MSLETLAQQNNKLKGLLSSLPSRHDEDWKYSDLQFFKKQNYLVSSVNDSNAVDVDDKNKKITITLRSLFEEFNVPTGGIKGLKIQTQGAAKLFRQSMTNYFSHMGDLLSENVCSVFFDADFDSSYLVEMVYHPRETMSENFQFVNKSVQITFAENVTVDLVEKSYLNQKHFLNLEVQYHLQKKANVHLLKIEKGQADGRGNQTSRYLLEEGAALSTATVTMGAEWSRHNSYATLAGQHAEAEFLAAYIGQNKDYIDHHTFIEHQVGYTTSRQKYSGVLTEQAHAVFNGKVHICRDAQKSNAEQSNRNLLLSNKAHVDSKPELLIDADDVKAKHGATVGQLNPEEIFYLKSRGIHEDLAKKMLTKGFVQDIGLRLKPRLQSIFYSEIAQSIDTMTENL